MTLSDGERIRRHRDKLDQDSSEDDWLIRVRNVTADWPPKDEVELVEIEVRYSDAQSLMRYEQASTAQLLQVHQDAELQCEIEPVRLRRMK